MDTVIYKNPGPEEYNSLGQLLRNGELVAFPTETVYGLGANGLDENAIDKIYKVKGRPSDNPLILHVPHAEAIEPLVASVTDTAKALIGAFWPGPLTIVLPKSELVPKRVTGGLQKVAVRCPDSLIAQALLRAADVPVAAPSANLSGRPSPTSAIRVYGDLQGKIPAIIDGGDCRVGIESTIVDCSTDMVTILRPGMITEDMLRTIVPNVTWDTSIVNGQGIPLAPGMKYKHYAPRGTMTTYVGSSQQVGQTIGNEICNHSHKSIGLLVSDHTMEEIEAFIVNRGLQMETFNIFSVIYKTNHNHEHLAHSLYEALLAFDSYDTELILAEGVHPIGHGRALMNRMEKASNGRVIFI